jgi:hypothetical protein
MPLTLSRQSIASAAQLLDSLQADVAGLLVYKHLGLQLDHQPGGVSRYIEALESSEPDAVMELVKEFVSESKAIRTKASTRHVFDGHCRSLLRWLLHDGWIVDNHQLVRVAPAAEEATGVRDSLIEQLAASGLDADGGIRRCIEDASEAFIREPPDFNASTTNVRIALETIARAAASKRSAKGAAPYTKDSWGSALSYLRQAGVLESSEEEVLARVYSFISPGAHVPSGITEEEWARLARTFGLGAAYFVLKKHLGQP